MLVFDLIGHPTAVTCYAWRVGSEVIAVLHEGPVKSPENAVRASLVRPEPRSPGRRIDHPMDKASKSSNQAGEDQWELDEALRQDLGLSPLGDGQEPTDDDSFPTLVSLTSRDTATAEPGDEDVISIPEDQAREETPSSSQFARPTDPGAITTLEAELAAASNREQVAAVAVRIAACYARASALFVVNNETIAGLCAEGEGLAERIEGVLISTAAEGLFSTPLSTGRAYRSAPSEEPDNVRLMRALGRSAACDVLVVPVRVGDRTVNLIYADNGPDRLADTAVAALVTLGSCLANVYERLISTSRN